MKKSSKKKYLNKRRSKGAQTAECKSNAKRVCPPTSDKPLTGLVITGIKKFNPRTIDHEIISSVDSSHQMRTGSQIIFKPQAVRQLQRYIDWGRCTKTNVVEQQGILLGTLYKTPSGYSGVVEEVILSDAIGNQVYVESSHSYWYKMDAQMDALNEKRKRKLVKLGWWHTHPNMNIFMSGTDKDTQEKYFYKDWQFAVVLNPQDRKWGAFIGKDARACEAYFLNSNVFKLKVMDELADKKSNKGGQVNG